jgi:GH15 family glucan-1,4-alpha-glucosidase
VKQRQLDAYGQLLQAAYLFGKAGGTLTPENWNFLSGLADITCDAWREPDQGIWEIRDAPRHFVHSKLNCWAALDRIVRIAEARRLPADAARWTRERDAVHDALLAEADERGWFPQALGSAEPDAAALLVAAMGLLPTKHPAVLETIEVVRRELSDGTLVHRYRAPDGVEGGEGAFLLCSFWLLDCLTFAGRLTEAEELLGTLLGHANDVGLYAEEVDMATGEALGNFPQAFTHMALVTSCMHLEAAKRGDRRGDEACDYAEVAIDRLLAAGRTLS